MHRSNVANIGIEASAWLIIAGFALAPWFGQATKSAAAPKVPAFKYDGAWPRLPLPNTWTFEGITGLTVDKDDVVWVLERPGDFDNDPIFRRAEVTENYASINPPTALCCKK